MLLRKLGTFWSLRPELQATALEGLLLALLVRAGFAVIGVTRTRGLLLRVAGSPATNALARPAEVINSSFRMQRLIERATGLSGTCLSRSLTLQTMLARRGIDTTLRIGLRKQDGKTEGHAWLEYNGQPINETPEAVSTYVLFEGAAEFALFK